MAERPIPEAWIGEYVTVLMGVDLEPFDGPLLQVNGRGVTVNTISNLSELEERRESGEPTEELREETTFADFFIPWQRVSAIGKRSVDKN